MIPLCYPTVATIREEKTPPFGESGLRGIIFLNPPSDPRRHRAGGMNSQGGQQNVVVDWCGCASLCHLAAAPKLITPYIHNILNQV